MAIKINELTIGGLPVLAYGRTHTGGTPRGLVLIRTPKKQYIVAWWKENETEWESARLYNDIDAAMYDWFGRVRSYGPDTMCYFRTELMKDLSPEPTVPKRKRGIGFSWKRGK